jgi:hypothetical protein
MSSKLPQKKKCMFRVQTPRARRALLTRRVPCASSVVLWIVVEFHDIKNCNYTANYCSHATWNVYILTVDIKVMRKWSHSANNSPTKTTLIWCGSNNKETPTNPRRSFDEIKHSFSACPDRHKFRPQQYEWTMRSDRSRSLPSVQLHPISDNNAIGSLRDRGGRRYRATVVSQFRPIPDNIPTFFS